MKFSEVMIHYDYKMSNIAKALKVDRQVVYAWKKKGRMPYEYQCVLQILTNGQLVASREEVEEDK